jgi:glycosyltransferase involved in cell wall biosynthesis
VNRATGTPALSVVVIGRNEGQRLTRCLQSVRAMEPIPGDIELIYVDSDSSDDSVERARELDAWVIEVLPDRPTAAIGRNAGWQAARAPYVLFLDGDTLLDPAFVNRAMEVFADPSIAGVCGARYETDTAGSVYNRVLDLDWRYPPGEMEYLGGDALMRRDILERVSGFDEGLIAGEEPDMWRRIRELGFKAWRLDIPMTGHDMAMTSFRQYWRRATRTGHAYAEVSERYRHSAIPLWRSSARRNRIHAIGLVGVFVSSVAAALLIPSPWPLVAFLLLFIALGLRTARQQRWRQASPMTLFLYGLHSHFQQIPVFVGQLGYSLSRRAGRRRQLIEYKR